MRKLRHLHVALHFIQDLGQPLDPVGGYPPVLHGLVDAPLHATIEFHAQGLAGIGLDAHAARGAVKRRDDQHPVHPQVIQPGFHRVRVKGGIIRVTGCLRIGQIRQDDAAPVHDGNPLHLLLGGQHDEAGQDAQGREQHRCQEGQQKETLLLDAGQVFPRNHGRNNSQIHITHPPLPV